MQHISLDPVPALSPPRGAGVAWLSRGRRTAVASLRRDRRVRVASVSPVGRGGVALLSRRGRFADASGQQMRAASPLPQLVTVVQG